MLMFMYYYCYCYKVIWTEINTILPHVGGVGKGINLNTKQGASFFIFSFSATGANSQHLGCYPHNSWRDTLKLNHHPPRSQLNTNSTDVKATHCRYESSQHSLCYNRLHSREIENNRLACKIKRRGRERLVTWPRAGSYVCNYDHNFSQWFSHINFSFHHFKDNSFFYQQHRLFP